MRVPCLPRRVRRPVSTLTLAAGLFVAACNGDGNQVGDPTTTTTTTPETTTTREGGTTTPTATPGFGQSCTHEERGVTIVVRYPDEWHVNEGDGFACSAFDPDPVQLRPATEYPADLAVVVRVEPVSFERASQPDAVVIEDEHRTEVDGRRAVRLEVISTGEGLRPSGERSVRWLVDAGPERSIVAHTSQVEGNDFETSKRVLDEMVRAFGVQPRTR